MDQREHRHGPGGLSRVGAALVCATFVMLRAVASAQATDPSGSPVPPRGHVSVDAFGDYHHSRLNFTDLPKPYDALDGYTVVRVQGWFEASRRVGGYVNVIPVVATADEFFLQRYVQFDVGLQAYPFHGALGPPRLYAQRARRTYYDHPAGAWLLGWDTRAGVDYYYDNLLAEQRFKVFAYADATFHTTNFGLDSYDAVVVSGNVETGWAARSGNSLRRGRLDPRLGVRPASLGEFLRLGPGVK